MSRTGRRTGGAPISRGHLYWILSNPIYVGRLRHKGQIHDGLHPAIVDPETWDRVQQQLKSQTQTRRISRPDDHSFLAGKLYDDRGNRTSASHASKGGWRWRYYVSRAALTGRKQDAGSVVRIPASEIENRIARAVGTHLAVQASAIDDCHINYGVLGGNQAIPQHQQTRRLRGNKPIRVIAADLKHLGAETGMIAILHTWGQTLTHHPHVHCIVPGGGLGPDGRWIPCKPNLSKSSVTRRRINAAIRDVIEITHGEAMKNGVAVRTELVEGLPLVPGDRVELQQVILNLVLNALEAMRTSGSLRLRLCRAIRVRPAHRRSRARPRRPRARARGLALGAQQRRLASPHRVGRPHRYARRLDVSGRSERR